MKKSLLALAVILTGGIATAQSVFMNEIHYDNVSTDLNEGVEIAGPAGTDLSTYSIVLYNLTGGAMYSTTVLSGSLTDMSGCGYGVKWFPILGIQNGPSDGIALVQNGTDVIQFLSYEGTVTATDGPASGLTSTDIGVLEDGTVALSTESLQLTGNGTVYTDFTWANPATSTNDAFNNSQDFCAAATPTAVFASATATYLENAGTVTVTVNINPAPVADETIEITVADGTATYTTDYTTNPDGSSAFNIPVLTGISSVTFDLMIVDDASTEANEDLTFTISASSAGITIGGTNVMTVTINDNDQPITPIATIQATTGGDQSDMLGQVVKTGGIVSGLASNGFFIQDASAQWSGIFVFDNGVNAPSRGDSVIVLGTVAEFAPGASAEKATQISTLQSFENIGAFTVHPAMALSTLNTNAEAYESVLVSVTNATCTAPIVTFGEYSVNDGSGVLVVDDLMYLTSPTPVVNDIYNITGVVGHNFGAYKLMPRDAADVVLVSGAGLEDIQNTIVSVYPNPSTGLINIKNANGATVEVYNTLGKLVLSTKNDKINLNSGLYFVKVGTSTTRVVVK